MANLSRRERRLLYGLLLFALAALAVWWVFLPGMGRVAELQSRVDALEETAQQMQAAQQQGQADRAFLDQGDSALYDGGRLSDVCNSQSLDSLVTSLVQDAGLTATALSIGLPQPVALPDDPPERAYAQLDDGEQAFRVDVEVVATGSVSHMLALCDAVASTQGLDLVTLRFEGAVFYIGLALYPAAAW